MKLIRLTQGKFAQIDDEDFDVINKYKWHLFNPNYAASWNRGNITHMHRLIMGCTKGDGKIIDHIDGNGFNNQKYNLRICSKAQNGFNRKKETSRNLSSKYKGVSWHKDAKRWVATIGYNNKTLHIGCFKTEEGAAEAYDKLAKLYFGEFANLNIIISQKPC